MNIKVNIHKGNLTDEEFKKAVEKYARSWIFKDQKKEEKIEKKGEKNGQLSRVRWMVQKDELEALLRKLTQKILFKQKNHISFSTYQVTKQNVM